MRKSIATSFVENAKRRASVTHKASEDETKDKKDEKKHRRNHSRRKSSAVKISSVTGLPPCSYFHTRDSLEEMTQNDVEHPRHPFFYKPPFRRNFRYFGYPRDLNPDLNTPPRIRSWGPIEEDVPRFKPKRTPYACKMDEAAVDPYWPGRLLKNCTILENPTLVPAMRKAVKKLGRKPTTIVRPDLDFTECVSNLYFPLTESSRKTFCRINKIVKDDMVKKAHDLEIQKPSMKKKSMTKRAVRKSEIQMGRKPKKTVDEARNRRASRFSIVDLERNMEEIVFYERANTPEVLKLFCVPESYPGKNKQLYGRPANQDDVVDLKLISSDDDVLIKPDLKSAYEQFSVPEDLWEKLAKVRARKAHVQRITQQKKKKSYDKEFKTFTQLEMRNETLGEVSRQFLENLNRNVQTPLPPELFEDNRDKYQPPHNYHDNEELPAQGPFYWKNKAEEPPNAKETIIIDKYIESLKEHHNFSHHLPGLLYVSKHPFPPLELDWFEKGSYMAPPVTEHRKSPKTFHDIPYYVAQLSDEKFEQEFEQARKEKAKDLVGPVVYKMYRQLKGIKSPTLSETELEAEEMADAKPQRKKIWIRKPKPKPIEVIEEEEVPQDAEEKHEDEEEEEEEEEEDEDEGEKEEEDVRKSDDDFLAFLRESEAAGEEYDLTHDLEVEEDFPLPDVRFSHLDLPPDLFPDTLNEKEVHAIRKLLSSLEVTDPVRKDEEEPVGSDELSTSTDSDLDLTEPPPARGEDPTEHLQAIYHEAVMARHKSRATIKLDTLKPPELKDVFLENTFVGDIENLLHHHPNIPTFLQLF